MPSRIRADAMQASDLHAYLTSQDDFALELFVFSQARSHGYLATHAGTYEDPVSGKPRQYDVRASITKDARRIDLAIECKNLRTSYPLMVSRTPRIGAEAVHQFVFSRNVKANHRVYLPSASPSLPVTVTNSGLYPETAQVGKSTVQVGKGDKGEFVASDSEVYDKWAQALASAHGLIRNAEFLYHTLPGGVCATIVLPVLVVSDDTLWVADYAESGLLLGPPVPAAECEIFVGQTYDKGLQRPYTISHLHVVTRSALAPFLNKIASDEYLKGKIFPEAELVTALRGSVQAGS